MSLEHEQKLRDLARRAQAIAELIRQDGDSVGPVGHMPQKLRAELRSGGPDKALLTVESCARQPVVAINIYLGPRGD